MIGGWLSAWPADSATADKSNPDQWPFTTPGTLPTLGDGVVERSVCFDYNQRDSSSNTGLSCFKATVIGVVNCGTHYLWRLPDVPDCPYNTAYCTV